MAWCPRLNHSRKQWSSLATIRPGAERAGIFRNGGARRNCRSNLAERGPIASGYLLYYHMTPAKPVNSHAGCPRVRCHRLLLHLSRSALQWGRGLTRHSKRLLGDVRYRRRSLASDARRLVSTPRPSSRSPSCSTRYMSAQLRYERPSEVRWLPLIPAEPLPKGGV